MMQVMVVREMDETLAQLAADWNMSKEDAASLLLESALVMRRMDHLNEVAS